jgi:hypothetical protein
LETKAILEQVLRIIMPQEIVKNFQFKELKETKDGTRGKVGGNKNKLISLHKKYVNGNRV